MAFRFLHSSDLHLGKPFGTLPETIRGRLGEARHQCLERLAAAAREAKAAHVLLAGDTFDAETPAPATLRQALNAMGQAGDLRWVLLPGNHDSLAASELWRRVAADAPPNLTVATEASVLALAPGVDLLPAPCTQRRPGRDLTAWMEDAKTDGTIRIGLAHGAITDFRGEEDTPGIIPPDRAERAGLDYLALGDWHGTMAVGARTRYSGTPERDRFKHQGPAVALAVTIDEPGAPPEVAEVPTGAFDWTDLALDLVPGADAAADLRACLPAQATRRNTLLRLTLRGRVGLPERAALVEAIAAAEPDFGWLDADLAALGTEARTDDLDLIDRGGALRSAAEALLAESADPALAESDRAIAATALARLFDLAAEGKT